MLKKLPAKKRERNKEPACQCRGHRIHGFDPWVRKIPWRRAWQPTQVFMPGELWAEEPGGPQSFRIAESRTRMK